jgi:hypothetical protein
MPEYQRLLEDHRNSRRSVADAINVLHEAAGFGAHDRAKIRVGLMRLPSNDIVGLVDVLLEASRGKKVYVASLPTSAHFCASSDGAGRGDLFEIARLHDAIVDTDGNVRLVDGTHLHAVEVVPSYLPYNPTQQEWRIVRAAIAALGAEERCYRCLRNDLPIEECDMAPDWRGIDCSKLAGLELPPLKDLAWRIAKKDPTLGELSQQKIADALRRFGMRIPKPRPRVR